MKLSAIWFFLVHFSLITHRFFRISGFKMRAKHWTIIDLKFTFVWPNSCYKGRNIRPKNILNITALFILISFSLSIVPHLTRLALLKWVEGFISHEEKGKIKAFILKPNSELSYFNYEIFLSYELKYVFHGTVLYNFENSIQVYLFNFLTQPGGWRLNTLNGVKMQKQTYKTWSCCI